MHPLFHFFNKMVNFNVYFYPPTGLFLCSVAGYPIILEWPVAGLAGQAIFSSLFCLHGPFLMTCMSLSFILPFFFFFLFCSPSQCSSAGFFFLFFHPAIMVCQEQFLLYNWNVVLFAGATFLMFVLRWIFPASPDRISPPRWARGLESPSPIQISPLLLFTKFFLRRTPAKSPYWRVLSNRRFHQFFHIPVFRLRNGLDFRAAEIFPWSPPTRSPFHKKAFFNSTPPFFPCLICSKDVY